MDQFFGMLARISRVEQSRSEDDSVRLAALGKNEAAFAELCERAGYTLD